MASYFRIWVWAEEGNRPVKVLTIIEVQVCLGVCMFASWVLCKGTTT